jgi:hypothetical protein
MATQKQIKANRQNAQKSTGPKSDEGKAAVSQNAVKHGLFADSIVYGENLADYEAFHSKMFDELAPAGVVELVLAERAANLAWRLKRAERMQNQVIEDMIGRLVTSDPARRDRECYYINQGIYRGDPRMELDDLPLGRIATKDFAYCRVIDRMLMYERRIENSFHKTIRELERQKHIRQAEQQEAEQDLLRQGPNQSEEKNSNLKKQSQFVPGLNGATSYLEGDYEKIPPRGAEENKANQACPFGKLRAGSEQRRIGQFDASEPVRGEIATALRASQ